MIRLLGDSLPTILSIIPEVTFLYLIAGTRQEE